MNTFKVALLSVLFYALPANAANVSVEQLMINNGDQSTFTINASVKMTATPGSHIRFAPAANMTNATAYEPYVAGTTYAITLSPGAGGKSICAQAKDPQSGQESEAKCDTIDVQLYGPNYPTNISVRINDDALVTSDRSVKLILTGFNTDKVAISHSNNFTDAQWMPYSRVKQWLLSGGTGYKEVYVMFASGTGTVAQPVGDSIEYAAQQNAQPEGEIVIEDGLVETYSVDAQIKTRSITNADVVRFAPQSDMAESGPYQPVKTWIPFTLTPGAGVKRVCAQFKNELTEATTTPDCDTILLKAKGPSAPTAVSFKIENGAKESFDSDVMLTFKATNASRMAISNYADFKNSVWRPFQAQMSWNLLSGAGERTVYVMFASSQGHITDVLTQEIDVLSGGSVVGTPTPTTNLKSAPETPRIVRPLPTGVTPGMLVKQLTKSDVYYVGRDGYRYVFPNSDVFLSWYTSKELRLTGDGGKVVTLAAHTLSSIPIGGNVTYRPGKTLVKIPSDPRVYVVDEHGKLRWMTSAQVATKLFGTLWNKEVKDLPESLFVNYGIGENVNSEVDFRPDNVHTKAKNIADEKQLAGK